MHGGLRATGARALIEEKQQALRDARDLMARAERATVGLAPELRAFIVGQFEDLVSYAQASALLLEAMVHHFHLRFGRKCEDIPSHERLSQVLRDMAVIANDWENRQPHDEWHIARRLREWYEEITTAKQ